MTKLVPNTYISEDIEGIEPDRYGNAEPRAQAYEILSPTPYQGAGRNSIAKVHIPSDYPSRQFSKGTINVLIA